MMIRLIVLLLSTLATATIVLAQTSEENPGAPFQAVLEEFELVNTKLDLNRDAVLDTGRELRDLSAGGATHWVSPHWRTDIDDDTPARIFTTNVNVLNTSVLFPAVVAVNVYDRDGVFDAVLSRNLEVSPRSSVGFFMNPGTSDTETGWLEIVSDRKVFIEGRIRYREVVEGDNTSQHIRTMTWYRVDPEADSE
jgi:hypothetical protein